MKNFQAYLLCGLSFLPALAVADSVLDFRVHYRVESDAGFSTKSQVISKVFSHKNFFENEINSEDLSLEDHEDFVAILEIKSSFRAVDVALKIDLDGDKEAALLVLDYPYPRYTPIRPVTISQDASKLLMENEDELFLKSYVGALVKENRYDLGSQFANQLKVSSPDFSDYLLTQLAQLGLKENGSHFNLIELLRPYQSNQKVSIVMAFFSAYYDEVLVNKTRDTLKDPQWREFAQKFLSALSANHPKFTQSLEKVFF